MKRQLVKMVVHEWDTALYLTMSLHTCSIILGHEGAVHWNTPLLKPCAVCRVCRDEWEQWWLVLPRCCGHLWCVSFHWLHHQLCTVRTVAWNWNVILTNGDHKMCCVGAVALTNNPIEIFIHALTGWIFKTWPFFFLQLWELGAHVHHVTWWRSHVVVKHHLSMLVSSCSHFKGGRCLSGELNTGTGVIGPFDGTWFVWDHTIVSQTGCNTMHSIEGRSRSIQSACARGPSWWHSLKQSEPKSFNTWWSPVAFTPRYCFMFKVFFTFISVKELSALWLRLCDGCCVSAKTINNGSDWLPAWPSVSASVGLWTPTHRRNVSDSVVGSLHKSNPITEDWLLL